MAVFLENILEMFQFVINMYVLPDLTNQYVWIFNFRTTFLYD